MRLGMIQMNSAVDDRDANVNKAARYIDDLASQGADLVVLPEFFNTEYFAQYRDYHYLSYAEAETGHSITAMRDKAREHGLFICATILEIEGPGLYYDTAFMLGPDGEIVGKYRKVHPAAARSLEKIYFHAGNKFPVWDIRGMKVSTIICYDHLFPESARAATINGAELVVGPFAAWEQPHWDALMVTRAWENGIYLAPCNKVGQEDTWVLGGASMVVDPSGEILHRASTEKDEVFAVDLDRSDVVAARAKYQTLRDRNYQAYRPLVQSYEEARGLA